MEKFLPEGSLLQTVYNKEILACAEELEKACRNETILESRASMSDADHNLIVDIPGGVGIIPRAEGAVGIAEGTTRDIAILSRVNKPVCFVITSIKTADDGTKVYILSRRRVQERCLDEYISTLKAGDVIPARVTHLENFGAFVDIGCGLPSLIPIDAISVSRINHPSDRFVSGQEIFAAVKSVEGSRVCLTHRELLGTWEQNASAFEVGSTVTGIVRSVESYGIFIELAPNLAGLAEPRAGIYAGQVVTVNIKAIKPERMKIKLAIVDTDHGVQPVSRQQVYYIDRGHIDRWQYSPDGCSKVVVTEF